ncbi:sigma-70 family RNA polymerase sigma factor [Amycolatopsis alkalitolerans]|uniref:Sigma-70 family RNA polymerase sigma factor n=1 Tax=Amycolatopsis alkalitolerans TaxID=2547244 RepID=A0A5C4M0G6_9PSEU|nr:sigma-70 family RNA polymerase sigma factor [Amycolatopsis alkalitolerans]TNC24170.1 sigma-70 family RNA polymerase sigma factor [Amycolatopsis alkalitolerans]
MDEREFLAARFEEHRPRLRAVAYRILGSVSEAEDAVQEAWLRVDRDGGAGVDNLGGWLTTIVGRVCLNMLRTRRAHPEEPIEALPEPADSHEAPEDEAMLADSVGLALLVVLDTLEPGERLAFVLHDLFAVPFDEIAGIMGRTPAATRQLASRARRRVRGAPVPEHEPQRQRAVVEAFLAAARGGDLEALMAVLDPEVVLHSGTEVLRGARAVASGARAFTRVATHGRLMLAGDTPAAAGYGPDGALLSVALFTVAGDRILAMDIVRDPDRIAALDLVPLPE